ncbi:MAG: hypothetical protein HY088_02775 [Ignavibacteriales bacterium]|nr:hypothetical protein [Ignavibacteriales bacterium]
MKLKLIGIIAFGVMLLQGCGKKEQATSIAGWERYQDPYFKVTFTYPKGWHVVAEGGKVSLYTSESSVQKFFDPTMKGSEDGAQLVVYYERMDTVRSLESYADEIKSSLSSSGFVIKAVEPATIEGNPASKITYSGRFEGGSKLQAVRVVTIKDTLAYIATYAAFNDFFTPNAAVIDSFIASAQLPKPKSASTAVDPSIPSTEYEKFSNAVLDISYPNNFEIAIPQPKGEVQFSLQIKGYRQDCFIVIDQRPAKNLTVEKVYDQNAKSFKPISKGETTIDGVKALFVNYSAMKNTESRAYFIVKNDKFYRVIMNYYQPSKKDLLPAFEKTVASLHIK